MLPLKKEVLMAKSTYTANKMYIKNRCSSELIM